MFIFTHYLIKILFYIPSQNISLYPALDQIWFDSKLDNQINKTDSYHGTRHDTVLIESRSEFTYQNENIIQTRTCFDSYDTTTYFDSRLNLTLRHGFSFKMKITGRSYDFFHFLWAV